MNWLAWFRRWEDMQDCYVLQRRERFRLMLEYPGFPKTDKLKILDLGCGPGSLALQALKHFPNARAVAIDSDPVMLTMGREAAGRLSGRIQFMREDLRKPEWLAGFDNKFDLALSATALHWLSAAHLARTFKRVSHVLKPGGWFLNSDHVADDNPKTQARFRKRLRAIQNRYFVETGIEGWDGFWQGMESAIGCSAFRKIRPKVSPWEGTDDGQPPGFHFTALEQAGFRAIQIVWRELGEAVIAARKPDKISSRTRAKRG